MKWNKRQKQAQCVLKLSLDRENRIELPVIEHDIWHCSSVILRKIHHNKC